MPLEDVVLEERVEPWRDRLQWAEGQIGAARSACSVVAQLPPDRVGRAVAQVARLTGLPAGAVTDVLLETVGEGAARAGPAALSLKR